MAREIEIKFAVDNEKKMIGRLLSLGAQKVSSGLEHNVVFDNGEIRKKGLLLRLRKTAGGKNVLTFKRPVINEEFKETEEIEIVISDFERMKDILKGLGYEIFWIYEKERTEFVLGGTKIFMDRLPFGSFVEIEGSAGGIRSAIARLGLDPKKGMTKTYLQLYQDYCDEKGIERENLVFWKKARPRV